MKLVYGIGINDLRNLEGQSKIYQKWRGMLKRCYSESYQKLQPTYIGCSVCDEWLTFSKFKAWMETQDWEGKQLDKDLLIPGNKVYSSETCVFISQELNNFLTERTNDRGLYPIGVSFDKTKNKFESYCSVNGKQIRLGRFDTPDEAHDAWLKKKLEIALNLAFNQTDLRIAKAIVNRYRNYQK